MKVFLKVSAVIIAIGALLMLIISKYVWAVLFAAFAVFLFTYKGKMTIDKPVRKHETISAPGKEPEIDFTICEFAVAGVTFKNDDGKSRQKILKTLCEGEESGWEAADLEECDYNGSPAIQVLTDEGCVGFIRHSDVQTVRRILQSKVYSTNIDIETFENEDDKTIYRCDVNLKVDKNDPSLKWYFDEL